MTANVDLLRREGAKLPPPESEYAEVKGGFTCSNCSYGKEGGTVCVYGRWGSTPPFDVHPEGCCRNFERAGMKAVGAPEGFPVGARPLSRALAGAKGPLGNQGVRERKPTEPHLERLIQGYVEAYLEAARAAAEAAVEVLRQGGTLGVRLPEAREAYLKALLPILDQLDAIVADAVRLGAARRWDPRERGDDIERLVALIVPQVRRRREYWLRKMATDFVRTVLLPALEAEPEDGEPRVAGYALPGFRAREGLFPVEKREFFREIEFFQRETEIEEAGDERVVKLGFPEKEYEFPQDFLDELLEKGYRFGNVRAIEATEHDVWNGDDVAYIEACREDGVQFFIWRTGEDPLVCPMCDELDGERYSPAEAEQASADRGGHTHCRCRCYFEAVAPESVDEQRLTLPPFV